MNRKTRIAKHIVWCYTTIAFILYPWGPLVAAEPVGLVIHRGPSQREPKEFLTRKEASTFLESLGCPVSYYTLSKYAENNNAGHGPPFTRYRWK